MCQLRYTARMSLSAHAYMIKGDASTVEAVLAILEKEGINTKGNPDLITQAHVSFTMDDARTLRERAALRAVGKHGRIFVLAAPVIPPDAQNALLKTFEEPPAGARFFLIVASPETLLPTLRSRMQTLEVIGSRSASIVEAKAFLAAPLEKRIEMLKPFLEKDDDDKRDLSGAVTFLAELEVELSKKPKENLQSLRAVYRARKYITDRGALTKALLEQVALLV